jgi:hypothetical protein
LLLIIKLDKLPRSFNQCGQAGMRDGAKASSSRVRTGVLACVFYHPDQPFRARALPAESPPPTSPFHPMPRKVCHCSSPLLFGWAAKGSSLSASRGVIGQETRSLTLFGMTDCGMGGLNKVQLPKHNAWEAAGTPCIVGQYAIMTYVHCSVTLVRSPCSRQTFPLSYTRYRREKHASQKA